MYEPDELEAAVDEAIAQCDGDARAAVRALILTTTYLEGEIERLAEAVSKGYARGQLKAARSASKKT